MSSTNGNVMDWQGKMDTIQDRMKHLLETGLNADVEFLVGTGKKLEDGKEEKQLIKAHKFILATGSSVFAAQFRFDGSTSNQDNNAPIEIKDISASAFNAILQYLYTNDISLINNKNFVGVYSAAKKYFLYALVQKCIKMAETKINKKNVFDMLRMAKLHEDTVLIEHCWAIIDDIDGFDDDEMFYELSREEMGEIFGRDSLQTYSEIEIFYLLEVWSAKQCEKEGIPKPTGEQKRAKMGALLNLIRFPLLDHDEFINEIVPTDILTKEEIISLFFHYCEGANDENKADYPLPFSAQPRAVPPGENNKLVDKFTAENNKAKLNEEIEKKNSEIAEKNLEIDRLRTENEQLQRRTTKPSLCLDV